MGSLTRTLSQVDLAPDPTDGIASPKTTLTMALTGCNAFVNGYLQLKIGRVIRDSWGAPLRPDGAPLPSGETYSSIEALHTASGAASPLALTVQKANHNGDAWALAGLPGNAAGVEYRYYVAVNHWCACSHPCSGCNVNDLIVATGTLRTLTL